MIFEYKIERLAGGVFMTEERLNLWGLQGWELVDVTGTQWTFKKAVARARKTAAKKEPASK